MDALQFSYSLEWLESMQAFLLITEVAYQNRRCKVYIFLQACETSIATQNTIWGRGNGIEYDDQSRPVGPKFNFFLKEDKIVDVQIKNDDDGSLICRELQQQHFLMHSWLKGT